VVRKLKLVWTLDEADLVNVLVCLWSPVQCFR